MSTGRSRVWQILTKKRGTPMWDAIIRTTGVLGLLALWPASVWPDVGALVGFVLLTIVVNGPLSPFFPATYEPVLMAMGRAWPPVLIGFIGILGILYVEVLNYHLYRAALLHPRLDTFREKRLVQRVVRLFRKSPFLAVWLCSWSPLPYWAVRILAPLARYPLRPYLLATFLGRFPRLWFFAAMGTVLPVPTSWLIGMAVVLTMGGMTAATIRARRNAAQAGTTDAGGAGSLQHGT